MKRKLSSFVRAVLLLVLFAQSALAQLRNDPFNTLPDNNNPHFRTDSQSYWKYEEASREGRHFSPFVYSGGLHATSVSLTSPAFATEAFVPERVNQTSTAITYVAAAADVCWTIVSSDTDGIAGWTHTGTTAYYHKCQGSTTPVQPTLPPNSAWLMQVTVTGSALVDVSSAQNTLPISPTTQGVIHSVYEYGAKCDNSTDDTRALQRALNAGGFLTLPTGVTCIASLAAINSGILIGGLNMGRSLLMASNSHLHIPLGTTLKLDGVRLSSIGKTNVAVTGPGAIQCVNQVYTNDAFTGQGSFADGTRGCVEFTGIGGAIATRFLLDGVELYGDGACSQGAGPAQPNKGKYGTLISQASHVRLLNNYLRCFDGEALYIEGGAVADIGLGWDDDIWVIGNRVDGTNRDNINFNSVSMVRSVIAHNYVRNGAGIEAASGIIHHNTLVNSSIFIGGACGSGFTIEDNQIDVGSIIVGLNCANVGAGQVLIRGNHVRNAPGTGSNAAINVYNLSSGSFQVVDVSNNVVNSWATDVDTYAYNVTGLLYQKKGVFKNNVAFTPGAAFSTAGCFTVDREYAVGDNFCPPGVKAYETFLTGGLAKTTQAFVSPDQHILTGTLTETNIRVLAIPKGHINLAGCILIHASGIIAGGAGTKTVRLYMQTSAGVNKLLSTITEAAGEADNWRFDGVACDTYLGTTTSASVLAYQGTTIEQNAVLNGSVALSMPAGFGVIISGQLGSVGDTISMVEMMVTPIFSFPF